MKRRQCLTLAAGLAGSSLAFAAADEAKSAPFGRNPWLQPLRGYVDGLDRVGEGLRVRGTLPAGLAGTLYRNGPGLLERAGRRYAHWFDGDGLLQAWQIGADGRVRHQARFVQTRKFQAEQQAGEFLVPAFGTRVEAKLPVRGPDDMNTANTSVTVQGGRLYALWEGGSAIELDPKTLRTLGPRAWAPELAGVPFSAHPKREPVGDGGTLWNFGTFAGKLVLYQIAANGQLQRHALLNLPTAAMVHDFVVTRRWIVFLLPPLTLDFKALRDNEASFAGAMRWQGDRPMRAVVIDKATLAVHRVIELPPQLLFHFGNAWDEGANGEHVHLDFVRTDVDDFLSGRFNSVLGGEGDSSQGHSRAQFLRLDLATGRARQEERAEEIEFPQVDPRVVGRRHRYLYAPRAMVASSQRWGFQAVQRLDLQRQQVERFDFGADTVVEEQLLVPKPGSTREGEGWLIGTGFDARAQRSFLTVFDAEALSAGPQARVDLPYWVPYGFHGHFEAA